VRKIVVGVSGASGSAYAHALLRALARVPEVEVHLVLSGPSHRTIALETDLAPTDYEE
jgi:3-polyprenyl-4-hydroxybenzoate decarboxylase